MNKPQPSSAEFSAVVTDIRLESREGAGPARWRMTLDRTNFTPGSTGVLRAVSRSGTRIEVPVLAVIDVASDIWHIVEKPLAAGTDVTARVTR
jgi:alanyl-tRNA synthetase